VWVLKKKGVTGKMQTNKYMTLLQVEEERQIVRDLWIRCKEETGMGGCLGDDFEDDIEPGGKKRCL
jgi:hypothetical protein